MKFFFMFLYVFPNALCLKTKFGLTYYQRARPLQCRIQGIGLLIGLCMILPILWSQHITNHCHHTRPSSHTHIWTTVQDKPLSQAARIWRKLLLLLLLFANINCTTRSSHCEVLVTVVREIKYNVFYLWGLGTMRAMTSLLRFLDHKRRTTVGRTPLDE
jgi:hypothetical protein